MVNRLLYSLVLSVALSVGLNANDLAKPPFKIVLKRSYSTGMKTREVITVSTRASVKQGDDAPRVIQQDLKLECDILVVSVDNGHWQQLQVTPTAIDVTAQGNTPAFSAINLPVTATRKDGIVSFERVDGKPLPVTDIQILKKCFVPAGELTPDQLAGTDKLHSPGDSWPVNSENLAKQLSTASDGGMTCKVEHTKGSMTLFKIWDVKGKRYLQVGGTATYEPVALSGPKFHQFAKGTAKASLSLNYQLPVNPELPAAKMEETFSVTISAEQNGPDGPAPMIFETTVNKMRRLTVIKTGTGTD